MKGIASGFWYGPDCYFSDNWNRMDGTLVSTVQLYSTSVQNRVDSTLVFTGYKASLLLRLKWAFCFSVHNSGCLTVSPVMCR